MPVAITDERQKRIAAVRHFNRFYTQHIGVLRCGWLGSRFSLTEARVLYEIRQRATTTANDVVRALELDAGHLSRILRRFHARGLIRRQVSPEDARRTLLSLTRRGEQAFAPLEARTNAQVSELLDRLTPAQQQHLVASMRAVENLMAERPGASEINLRAPRPGDYGWMLERHGVLYAAEQGWDQSFEALCAQIISAFLASHDPQRERCWIAELDGERAGSVFVARDSDEVARLRLLLVEPAARGRGLDRRLVDECIAFARAAGYRRMTLWTQNGWSARGAFTRPPASGWCTPSRTGASARTSSARPGTWSCSLDWRPSSANGVTHHAYGAQPGSLSRR